MPNGKLTTHTLAEFNIRPRPGKSISYSVKHAGVTIN
jgi:hypothetical protein